MEATGGNGSVLSSYARISTSISYRRGNRRGRSRLPFIWFALRSTHITAGNLLCYRINGFSPAPKSACWDSILALLVSFQATFGGVIGDEIIGNAFYPQLGGTALFFVSMAYLSKLGSSPWRYFIVSIVSTFLTAWIYTLSAVWLAIGAWDPLRPSSAFPKLARSLGGCNFCCSFYCSALASDICADGRKLGARGVLLTLTMGRRSRLRPVSWHLRLFCSFEHLVDTDHLQMRLCSLSFWRRLLGSLFKWGF